MKEFVFILLIGFLACTPVEEGEVSLKAAADMTANQAKLFYDNKIFLESVEAGSDATYTMYQSLLFPYVAWVAQDTLDRTNFYIEEFSDTLTTAQIGAEIDTVWINRTTHTYESWTEVYQSFFN